MSQDFAELDYQKTPLGDLVLRRRRMLSLGGIDVFEVKLGDAFLMSSLFHEVEEQLAHSALAELAGERWDVIVGGLGLGYTALAALEHENVRSLAVVEVLRPVIDWHERGLVPLGQKLTADPRCRIVHGDFFALAKSPEGFDARAPGRRFHAVLLDIDHSPCDLLDSEHAWFYRTEGLRSLASHLHPGGVFGIWSDDPPDEDFMKELDRAFGSARANIVTFPNPLLESNSASTVYVARKSEDAE